ncbi:MAG: nuclear transport factor 2 family protein [Nitrososphaera sp.]
MPLTRNITEMSNEEIVRRYFKLIESQNLPDLVDMFDYDAVLKEPFSKMPELKGRSEISAFLKVALMANSDMRRKLEVKSSDKTGKTRALVTFEKGDKLKGQFTFDIDPVTKKIRALKIEFLT